MRYFEDLGRELEQRWRGHDYLEDVFATLAASALNERPRHEAPDAWDIIRWVQNTSHLPQQAYLDSAFGQPPVTLFMTSRFQIDAYFWLDGTTAIHQHGFSGAFQVLAGSSIHSEYHFTAEEQVSRSLSIGQVSFASTELLKVGDARPIRGGPDFIHALFHLERPSVTLCIRTSLSPAWQPQWSYHTPSLAVDPFFREPHTVRSLQCCDVLFNVRPTRWLDDLTGFLEHADFHTAYLLLLQASQNLERGARLRRRLGVDASQDAYARLQAAARRRHGARLDVLGPVLAEAARQEDIVQRRSKIDEESHRFLLALLLNVPGRRAILDLIARREPHLEPVGVFMDWVHELCHIRTENDEGNVLGLARSDEAALTILGGLLDDKSVPDLAQETGLTTCEVDAAVRSLRQCRALDNLWVGPESATREVAPLR